MYSRQFTQYIFGLVFLVSSSFALSNTEFTWYWYDESQVTLTGCVGQCPTNLAIPEEINTFSVRAIGEWAFNSSQLQNVIIPNSVEVIVSEGFSDNQLTNITIPDSVVSIGGGAFANNQLNSVLFKGSRPAMYLPFINNPNLQSIYYCPETEGWPGDPINQITPQLDESCDIPSDTDTGGDIGDNSGISGDIGNNNDIPENDSNNIFRYTDFFGEIIIEGCRATDELIFHGDCPDTLIIPETIEGLSVTGIRDNAFDSQNLTSVTIPDSVKHIGDYAFAYNTLTSVEFPSNLETIGEGAFTGNDLGSLVIPSSVREIGQSAFSSSNITSLTIGDGLTMIHEGVFSYNNISNLNLPSSIVSIGYVAFADNQLTKLTIPEGVTEISHHAFSGNQITDLTLPISLVNLGHYAFWDNEITNLTIPKKLNNIPASAFGNNNLISIFFNGDRPTIDPYAFLYNSNLTTIIFCPETIGWPGVAISLITPQIDESCVTQEQSEPTVYAVFDIDKDGSFDALTDGLILLRHAFGLTGDNLINGVISPDANQTSAADIETYIESHMP